jgi:hypothetical protein
MKHVKQLSKNSIPASAIFVIEIETKSECKTIPESEQDACKDAVKDGRIYSYVIL